MFLRRLCLAHVVVVRVNFALQLLLWALVGTRPHCWVEWEGRDLVEACPCCRGVWVDLELAGAYPYCQGASVDPERAGAYPYCRGVWEGHGQEEAYPYSGLAEDHDLAGAYPYSGLVEDHDPPGACPYSGLTAAYPCWSQVADLGLVGAYAYFPDLGEDLDQEEAFAEVPFPARQVRQGHGCAAGAGDVRQSSPVAAAVVGRVEVGLLGWSPASSACAVLGLGRVVAIAEVPFVVASEEASVRPAGSLGRGAVQRRQMSFETWYLYETKE